MDLERANTGLSSRFSLGFRPTRYQRDFEPIYLV